MIGLRRLATATTFAALVVSVAAGLAGAPSAAGSASPEQALAARYSPVVRLVAYRGDCESGEPFVPIDAAGQPGSPGAPGVLMEPFVAGTEPRATAAAFTRQ